MRNIRTEIPVPQSSQLEKLPNPYSMVPRRSSSSPYLPSLRESSSDCNALSRIGTPLAFSQTQQGKTEIVALVGSPSHPRRGKLFKSALERRSVHENSRFPDLIRKDSNENVQPALPAPSFEWVKRLHRPQQYELTRTTSHPVISNVENFAPVTKQTNNLRSKSLPQLKNGDTSRNGVVLVFPRNGPEDKHSADLRRHIEKEESDYDLFMTKAVILERFLNSQS